MIYKVLLYTSIHMYTPIQFTKKYCEIQLLSTNIHQINFHL